MLFVWVCVFVSAFTGRFVTGQSPLPPGSPQEVPVNRTDVLEAAQFAVVEFNKANTEDMFNYAILDITSAQVQVVQGLNYFLEMLLGRTTCKTGNTAAIKGNAAASDCDSNSEAKASVRLQVVFETPGETHLKAQQRFAPVHQCQC
ncbi:cystatin-F [Etheostoma spectabile]|uniref:cystatin-F n=1 Tax=Etheostoma spectabile TaxID=54343 RepID=UPI0013AEA313|nr:cystatin-F-like [Etheostoma spectabile]